MAIMRLIAIQIFNRLTALIYIHIYTYIHTQNATITNIQIRTCKKNQSSVRGSEFSGAWGKRGEGGQGREGVQLPDSLMDEAVLQSVGPRLETPQSPPWWQQTEEAVCRVGGITCNAEGFAGETGAVDVLEGGERDTNDLLSCSHYPLIFMIYYRFIRECHNRKWSLWHIGKAKNKNIIIIIIKIKKTQGSGPNQPPGWKTSRCSQWPVRAWLYQVLLSSYNSIK